MTPNYNPLPTKMSFPLYENLKQDLPKKDLTTAEKEQFMRIIRDIDEYGRDLMYVLIQCYRLEHTPECTSTLPYKGTEMASGDGSETSSIYWNFLEFPIPLRHILYKFIRLNQEKIAAEHKQNEARSSI